MKKYEVDKFKGKVNLFTTKPKNVEAKSDSSKESCDSLAMAPVDKGSICIKYNDCGSGMADGMLGDLVDENRCVQVSNEPLVKPSNDGVDVIPKRKVRICRRKRSIVDSS